jgi:hypothetical protein
MNTRKQRRGDTEAYAIWKRNPLISKGSDDLFLVVYSSFLIIAIWWPRKKSGCRQYKETQESGNALS